MHVTGHLLVMSAPNTIERVPRSELFSVWHPCSEQSTDSSEDVAGSQPFKHFYHSRIQSCVIRVVLITGIGCYPHVGLTA